MELKSESNLPPRNKAKVVVGVGLFLGRTSGSREFTVSRNLIFLTIVGKNPHEHLRVPNQTQIDVTSLF